MNTSDLEEFFDRVGTDPIRPIKIGDLVNHSPTGKIGTVMRFYGPMSVVRYAPESLLIAYTKEFKHAK